MIATAPPIADAVSASDNAYKGVADAATSERIDQVEKTWSGVGIQPAVGAILSSPASRFLRYSAPHWASILAIEKLRRLDWTVTGSKATRHDSQRVESILAPTSRFFPTSRWTGP